MYLGYQNNKIKFYSQTLLDKELYNLDKIEETQQEYVLEGDEFVEKNSEWEEKQRQKEKNAKIEELKQKLLELDEKRIRAVCENETKDEQTGQTWLEYYNDQAKEYRKQLSEILTNE